MKNKSAYWLNHTPTEKFNLIELAHTQRAISNFVKILTGKEIPVEFTTSGDSMTNGKSITISSKIYELEIRGRRRGRWSKPRHFRSKE